VIFLAPSTVLFNLAKSFHLNPLVKSSAQGRINSMLVLHQKEEISQGNTERDKQQRKRGKYTSSGLRIPSSIHH